MPAKKPDASVTLDRARAFWHHKQGLAAPGDDPAAVIASTGWARTLGGIDVYLAVRARCPSVTRAGLEQRVADGALRVVPAVRSCIYLVPERDVAVLMALAADLDRPRTDRELGKAGSSRGEVGALAREVLAVLADGALTTPEIRKALPEGAARSLGDAGKKIGLSSPLPVALRELEFQGEIERIPVDDRLDTERYLWRIPKQKPRAAAPADPAERVAVIARRFFEFFGPATVKELAAWVGVSQRDAKAAMAELPLTAVTIAGHAPEAWVLDDDLETLVAAAPAPAAFAFLSFADNLLSVHGGPGVHVDPAHHRQPVSAWGSSKPTTLGEARHLGVRTLLLGEKVIGLWEVDSDAGEVVAATFEPLSGKLRRALDADRERLAGFFRDQLGHARSFSLDTDDKVRERAALIRGMG
jgi:DNA glycosylase AlkZ-like